MEHHHQNIQHAAKDPDNKHQHHAAKENNPPIGHAGHDHAMMIDDFKKRFYIVLILTIPIMLLSEMIQHWLNINFSFPGNQFVLLVLSSIVFFHGGMPFLKGWINMRAAIALTTACKKFLSARRCEL